MSYRQIAFDSKAWPFVEASKLLKRYLGHDSSKGYILLETGYGPSGLPHIGTFGEVARTTMVQNALSVLSDIPSRLVAFSDDMDGLRKVPENIPNQEVLARHLGKPLTSVPDPFGIHESFGHYNNAKLQAFLNDFNFDYQFVSATEYYRSGVFDKTLRSILERYDDVIQTILPTLGPERQATYSPFLPICPDSGRVLQVPIEHYDTDAGTVCYRDTAGNIVEVPVTGGHCKLQWKVDWAMRWLALDVDYEMSGKDLIESVKLSSQVCRMLGGTPPVGFTYELFLDENGEKISKSVGNGIAIEEWLRYAFPESLQTYMFQSPKKAKRLFFDAIPRAVDDYLVHLREFPKQEIEQRYANPVWHIHRGQPPNEEVPISFNMLLNLASVCNAEDRSVLWGFITRYEADVRPETYPILDSLVGYAIAYHEDFIQPAKQYRTPTDKERNALRELAGSLRDLDPDTDSEEIQNKIYEIGKRHGFENLRDWFKALYEILFGQLQGPRMGSFVYLYGLENTALLIEKMLDSKQVDINEE